MVFRPVVVLFSIGALASLAAVVPLARAERALADAPCLPAARPWRLNTLQPPAYATALPTPSFQGAGLQRTLTVTGRGTAERAPDTAYLDVQLVAKAPDAATAACQNERAYVALRAKVGAAAVQDGSTTFPGGGPYVSRAAPQAGASRPPAARWVATRIVRIVAAPPKLADALAAVEAVHGTTVDVQYGLVDREAAYEAALATAMRDAAEQAAQVAASEHVQVGRVARVDVTGIEASSAGPAVPYAAGTARASPQPVAVRATATVTFPVGADVSGARPDVALIAVHPLGSASRAPDFGSVNVEFVDRGNDRTALLYRHESAYDALWAKLRTLGIAPAQMTTAGPQAIGNPVVTTSPPVPPPGLLLPGVPQYTLPIASPTPYLAYTLFRFVRVDGIPVANLNHVIAAFAEAGADSAEVSFSVADRSSVVAEANANLRRNAAAQAQTVAAAAGLRIVEPPYVEGTGYPLVQASIARTSIGTPQQPRSFEAPARIDAPIRGTFVFAATR